MQLMSNNPFKVQRPVLLREGRALCYSEGCFISYVMLCEINHKPDTTADHTKTPKNATRAEGKTKPRFCLTQRQAEKKP